MTLSRICRPFDQRGQASAGSDPLLDVKPTAYLMGIALTRTGPQYWGLHWSRGRAVAEAQRTEALQRTRRAKKFHCLPLPTLCSYNRLLASRLLYRSATFSTSKSQDFVKVNYCTSVGRDGSFSLLSDLRLKSAVMR